MCDKIGRANAIIPSCGINSSIDKDDDEADEGLLLFPFLTGVRILDDTGVGGVGLLCEGVGVGSFDFSDCAGVGVGVGLWILPSGGDDGGFPLEEGDDTDE